MNLGLRAQLSGLLVAALFVSVGEGAWGDDAADSQPAAKVLLGEAAMGDYTSDAPGVRRLIKAEDLPAFKPAPYLENFSNLVPRPEGALPVVPKGFQVALLAEKLVNPRKIVTAPNGDLFVAESSANRVRVIRQVKGGGAVESSTVFAEGLKQPFGIAFYPPGDNPTHVYIGNTDSVVRFAYKEGDLTASGKQEMIVADIPGGGKLQGGGHWTRDVVFARDGSRMFVSVGSKSNNSDDPVGETHRANVLTYKPDGSDFKIFANGIRNAVGLAVEPVTGSLWGSCNERDEMGDNLPPDYISSIHEGDFFGWPWFYSGNHADPKHIGKHPELAATVKTPDVLLQAHSSSLCMTFYSATAFPKAMQGDAFAAEHGSWNRTKRTGYKVIRVPMEEGKATGEYEDFMTGFVLKNGDVWGRPVGVTVDGTGALVISDDGGNCLWRVSWGG